MNLPGEFAAVWSMRLNTTEAAGSASPFFETKTRPVVVAAHRVLLSAVVRSRAATFPPERVPKLALVSVTGPSLAQSPQTTVKSPKNSLQCERNEATDCA